MRKTICDVCGKGIIDFRESWNVSIVSNVSLRTLNFGQTDYSLCLTDVCEDCTNSICHYIEGLQKEDNK